MEYKANRRKLPSSSSRPGIRCKEFSPPPLKNLWCGAFPHFNLSPSDEIQDQEFGTNLFNSQEYAALRSQIRSQLKEMPEINQANRPTSQEVQELYLLLTSYLPYPLAFVRHHKSRLGSSSSSSSSSTSKKVLGPSYTPLFGSFGSIDMMQDLRLLRGVQSELYQAQLETSLTLVTMVQCLLVQAELSSSSEDTNTVAKQYWFQARSMLVLMQSFCNECIEAMGPAGAVVKGLKFIRQFARVLERKCLIHYVFTELQSIYMLMEQMGHAYNPVPIAKRIRQVSTMIRAAYTLSSDAVQHTKELLDCETTRQLVWLCQGYQVYLKSVYFWYEQVIYSSDCQEEIALKYCDSILHETRKMPKVPEYSHRHHQYFSHVAFEIQKAHAIVLNEAASVKQKLLSTQKQLSRDKHHPSNLRPRPSSAGSTRVGSSHTGSSNSNSSSASMDELLYTIPPLELPWDRFQEELSKQDGSIMAEYFELPPTQKLERQIQENETKLTQSPLTDEQNNKKQLFAMSPATAQLQSPRSIQLDPLPVTLAERLDMSKETTESEQDRDVKCPLATDDSPTKMGPIFGERPPLTKVQAIAASVRARYLTALTGGTSEQDTAWISMKVGDRTLYFEKQVFGTNTGAGAIPTTSSPSRNIGRLVTSRPHYLKFSADDHQEQGEDVKEDADTDNDEEWDEEDDEVYDGSMQKSKKNRRNKKIEKRKTRSRTATPSMSITPSWKGHHVACGLCEKRFLRTNLPGVVLMKRIFELRRSWGMVLHQEAKKFSVASSLYAKSDVCLMCKEMLSTDEDQSHQVPSNHNKASIALGYTSASDGPPKRPRSAPAASASSPPLFIPVGRTPGFSPTPCTAQDEVGALILNSIKQAWAQNPNSSASAMEDLMVDIALNKRARQSTTLPDCMAANALCLQEKIRFAHTKEELQPWWEVDLANYYVIHSIKVWIRKDANPLLLSTITSPSCIGPTDQDGERNNSHDYWTNTTKDSHSKSTAASGSSTNTYPVSLCLLMRTGVGRKYDDIIASSVSSLRVASHPSSLTPILWHLPPNSRGRFVRVQSEKNTKTFLHIEKVQVFIMKDTTSLSSFSANQMIVDGVLTNGNSHRRKTTEVVTQVPQPQKKPPAQLEKVVHHISMIRRSFLNVSSSPYSSGSSSNAANTAEEDEEQEEWKALCLENSTADPTELTEKKKASRLYARFRQLLEERSKYDEINRQTIQTPQSPTLQPPTTKSLTTTTSRTNSTATNTANNTTKNPASMPIRKSSSKLTNKQVHLEQGVQKSSSVPMVPPQK